MQSPRLWCPFSSTQKSLGIEREQSNTAALQIALFNQPWDFSANQLKQCLLLLHRFYLVLCAAPREWGAAHCPILVLMWSATTDRHKSAHLLPLPRCENRQIQKQQISSPFWRCFSWGIFWATPVFPQYNKDNNQKYTSRDLYMEHSAHIPSDVTLLMYYSTHWKCLIFPCF